MRLATSRPGEQPLERARRLLAEGDWAGARAWFEAAIARGESAEAEEGLSWAAWWQSDAPTVFRARHAAHDLYRRRGDRRGAARMAIWLASDYVEFRGELAAARGWRLRAARLLKGLPPGPEHGWLALHEGAVALENAGDPRSARRSAARAVRIGRYVGDPDVEMVGRAIDGLARVMEGDVDRGMALLDEATTAAAAGELQELVCVGWTFCYLIGACECVGDLARAGEWCHRVEELARRLRFCFWRGICRVHYASVLQWHGAWSKAEAELLRAAEDLRATRRPLAPEATVRLAELRRCQGKLDEAERLVAGIEDHPAAALGIARLAIDRGNPRRAADAIDRLLRCVPRENRLQRAEALEVLVRARVALGDVSRAAAAARSLRAIASGAGTGPLRAAARRAEGLIAAAGGRHEHARRCFEDCVDLLVQSGAPFATACGRLDLAESLEALDRPDDAAREARAALTDLERLGADGEARRARALLGRVTGPAAAVPLTGREREVMGLIAKDLGDKEIAMALDLSPHTVHRHVANVLSKLGVSSRAAALAYAFEHALVGMAGSGHRGRGAHGPKRRMTDRRHAVRFGS